MTCIVGIIDPETGSIFMGGDSAAVDGSNLETIKGSKVFIKNNMMFGISGRPRICDILRYNFDFPDDAPYEDPFEYLVKSFIPAFREALAENGFTRFEDDVEYSDSAILVGYKGRLFVIESDFHVSERVENYTAIGCGADLALGCLYGIGDLMQEEIINPFDAIAKINLALRASEKFNCHVREPFIIIKGSARQS